MSDAATGTIQYDLLGVPLQESSIADKDLEQIDAFTADTAAQGGLLLRAVCPTLLGVTQQRFHQMQKQYKFKEFKYFDNVWYSRKEIESFSKVHRSGGRGRVSLAAIAKKTKEALLK